MEEYSPTKTQMMRKIDIDTHSRSEENRDNGDNGDMNDAEDKI